MLKKIKIRFLIISCPDLDESDITIYFYSLSPPLPSRPLPLSLPSTIFPSSYILFHFVPFLFHPLPLTFFPPSFLPLYFLPSLLPTSFPLSCLSSSFPFSSAFTFLPILSLFASLSSLFWVSVCLYPINV